MFDIIWHWKNSIVQCYWKTYVFTHCEYNINRLGFIYLNVLLSNHSSARSVLVISLMQYNVSSITKNAVSSANAALSMSLDVGRSAVWWRYKVGPSTLSWGTPAVIEGCFPRCFLNRDSKKFYYIIHALLDFKEYHKEHPLF